MANYKTGAQRYNDKMEKIFAKSEALGNHTLHGSTEKKHSMAKKMSANPAGVMKQNNKTALEIDRHNRSWNGKGYTK